MNSKPGKCVVIERDKFYYASIELNIASTTYGKVLQHAPDRS